MTPVFKLCAIALCAVVTGCNSGSRLEPAVPVGQAMQAVTVLDTSGDMNPDVEGRTAVASGPAEISFAPVVGTSAKAVPPLSRRLSQSATENGISVASGNNQEATYLVKGYFSAISENGRTTVIYVWDVMDQRGNRLHRIQGQAKTEGGSGDAWSSVDDRTMETIADNTIQSLSSWLKRQS